jgi:hypothetical protein
LLLAEVVVEVEVTAVEALVEEAAIVAAVVALVVGDIRIMVTKTDTTQIITQPKLDEKAQPSLKRWLKHAFYFSASKRLFSKQDQLEITNAVKQQNMVILVRYRW